MYKVEKHATEPTIAVMRRIAERKGKTVEELTDAPERGPDIIAAWNKYMRVMKGCEQVTYSAISDFQRMTGETVNPWEIDLMIDLDMMRRRNGY